MHMRSRPSLRTGQTSRMRRYCRIRSFLLAGLLALVLPSGHARAVSISLVPDGPTTIEVGETVNVDVFMVLDAADQVVGNLLPRTSHNVRFVRLSRRGGASFRPTAAPRAPTIAQTLSQRSRETGAAAASGEDPGPVARSRRCRDLCGCAPTPHLRGIGKLATLR